MRMLPPKQSFLLALQTRQAHTSVMRLRASTEAAVMAEVRGTGAEIRGHEVRSDHDGTHL